MRGEAYIKRLLKSICRELILLPISPFVTRLWAKPMLGIQSAKNANIQSAAISTILVVRQDGIGDMILTSGFLRELRCLFPAAKVVVACHAPAQEIIANCPFVDAFHVLPGSPHQRLSPYGRFAVAWRSARELRQHKPDLCILPRWSADAYHSTYLAYFSGAPMRLGFGSGDPERRLWNRGYAGLLTHAVADVRKCHDVLHMHYLLGTLGKKNVDDNLDLWLNKDDGLVVSEEIRAFESKYEARGIIVAIAPGASLPSKRWPVESFSKLIGRLSLRINLKVVVVGGEIDVAVSEQLCQKINCPVLNMTGRLNLRETAAMLEQCDILISNDSAAVHMAVAVATPVVVLSWRLDKGDLAETDPYAPWSVSSLVVGVKSPISPCMGDCSYDGTHCISTILPDRVSPQVLKFLDSTGVIACREGSADA